MKYFTVNRIVDKGGAVKCTRYWVWQFFRVLSMQFTT